VLSVVCAASGLLMPCAQGAQKAPALSSPRLRRWGWANVCSPLKSVNCPRPPKTKKLAPAC